MADEFEPTTELPVDPVVADGADGADGAPASKADAEHESRDQPGAPDRTPFRIAAMLLCSALLAVLVGSGLRGITRTAEAAFIDAGAAPPELGYEERTTTTTAAPTTTVAVVEETTTTTAVPETVPEPTTTVTTAAPGPGRPLPPRPHINYTAKSSLDAFPIAQGQIQLSGSPGGPPGEISFNNPRQVGSNPEAKVPLVFLVKRDLGEWLEVYVPARPNGRTAYIKRSAVELRTNPYRIEVYLREYAIRVYDGDNLKLSAKIGVARSSTPTPVGIFFDTELVRPPNPSGPYGPYAFGLSGFSDVFYSFGGGPGQIGIHGTNQPSAIGTQVSSGCIRLHNKDISYLASFIPLGTPIIINDHFA